MYGSLSSSCLSFIFSPEAFGGRFFVAPMLLLLIPILIICFVFSAASRTRTIVCEQQKVPTKPESVPQSVKPVVQSVRITKVDGLHGEIITPTIKVVQPTEIVKTQIAVKREFNYCPYCGTKTVKDARFCSNCGESLN